MAVCTASIWEDCKYDKDAEDHKFEIRINMEWEKVERELTWSMCVFFWLLVYYDMYYGRCVQHWSERIANMTKIKLAGDRLKKIDKAISSMVNVKEWLTLYVGGHYCYHSRRVGGREKELDKGNRKYQSHRGNHEKRREWWEWELIRMNVAQPWGQSHV